MLSSFSSFDEEAFLSAVLDEFAGATFKFPGNKNQTVALMEEVGELSSALLDHGYGKGTEQCVYNEAVQVAAMAMRIALQGDVGFPYQFNTVYYDEFKPTGIVKKT